MTDEPTPAVEPSGQLVPVELLPEVVDGLVRELETLSQDVRSQREVIDALAEAVKSLAREENQERPSRWAWRHLTQDEAGRLWDELRDFVDHQLIARYAFASDFSIPPCWYAHPLAVEELTALYVAWRAVYCAGDAPTTALSEWHDRCLWPVLDRLARNTGWRECKEQRSHEPAHVRTDLTDDGVNRHRELDLRQRPLVRSDDLPWLHDP